MSAMNFVNPSSIAAAQFNGSGSYGNGGGMRVTPAAIYGLKLSTDDFNVSIYIPLLNESVSHCHFNLK